MEETLNAWPILKKFVWAIKQKKPKNNRKITITEPKLIRFFGYGYWLFGFGFGLRFVDNSVIGYFRFRFGFEPKNRMPTPRYSPPPLINKYITSYQ